MKAKAKFIGEVITKWLSGSRREMQLEEEFNFIDKNSRFWFAPKGAVVDGASIPKIFWLFIGSPFVGKYRRASVIHDVYCKTKSRPHKEVHRMFYEGVRVDGVNIVKAKTMYWAIKLGGPKW